MAVGQLSQLNGGEAGLRQLLGRSRVPVGAVTQVG